MLRPAIRPQWPLQFTPVLSKPSRGPIKLLKQLADTKNIRTGKMVHAHLIVTNEAANRIEATSLVNLYAKCGEVLVARRLFDEMPRRDVVSLSALMDGYLKRGSSLEVMRLFKDVVLRDGVRPNEYVFTNVISSCSMSGRIEVGRQCHGYVLKSGLVFHQYVRNELVYMYSKWCSAGEAMLVWDDVPGKDVFVYNTVLSGLVEQGFVEEGLSVFRRMVDELVNWDKITYVHVFGLCAGLKDLNLGLTIHGRLLMSDAERDEYVNSAIINMYGKCGKTSVARSVFDGLENRNVVLWTAIMDAYFQNRRFEEALNLFPKMQLEDVRPNEVTFGVLLNASAGLSTLRHGYLLHAHTEKSGIKDHVIVGNSLINMYAKSGNIEAAAKVFLDMIHRDSITWNVMICGYSHHGLGKEALRVFQDMMAANEHPNYVTFVGVLSACAHLGLVKEGFYYLNHLMEQIGIQPGLEHYTCILSLLSRAGKLDEAMEFMKSMPVKLDAVACRTLLNACHIHRNYGLGKKIAELIIEMEPSDVGTYTLLSNTYAKAKRWDEVVKIRNLMRAKNVKKEPGVSWIEVKNVTHIFASEDSRHPEYNQINGKVKELLAMIKPLGYVPDIGAVFHDVEEEQKEEYLSYHSEKLAIAYGFMKTPPEAPIIVIKNLRMCDDCHLAVKLISKVTKRVIIVRDANRFHRFQNGCCTCSDYW